MAKSNLLDKFKGGRLAVGKGASPVAPPDGAPLFLMVGSLANVSRKDAMQYARGMAEANVISPELGRLQLTHDKQNDRYVYEIHEGGTEFSIADKVLASLQAAEPIRIELVNGAHLTIEEAHGELFSLIHPRPEVDVLQGVGLDHETDAVDPSTFVSVHAFASTEKTLELFPAQKHLFKKGLVMVAVSAVLFITSGTLYTFKQAGWFDNDSLLMLTKAGQVAKATDNPAWQLEKARTEAAAQGKFIKALKKSPSGWSWELAQ
jgi:hypothetical protein